MVHLLRHRLSPEQIAGKLKSMDIPNHRCQWEVDLSKGKNNVSSVGTLVELSSGYLILAKMNDATATSVVEGFSATLNRTPTTARKTLTYDQGREMAHHSELGRCHLLL
ncbi:hypothetical protein SAMN05421509_101525 [Chromohalobacter canadensis]|uniref:Integrase catalytic domain-containing protein n=1 Tax=Chromohalobacter canadensis TaxID=141389 RepID=A0A285VDG8_9GAMM|nr:hypothetical protein SAMN05421509_101525 [Chromohalobacter canadensis]